MQFDQLTTIEIADKVLIYFKDHDMTNIYAPFLDIGMTEEDLSGGQYTRLMYNAIKALEESLEYIEKTGNSGQWYLLTDKGREVKAAGGHFAYRNKIDEKSKADNARQERKDKSDELDLMMKEWQVKTKRLPYILSFLALLGTIISISIAFKALNKKQDQQDLQPMQQQIQVLQDHVKSLDSLLQLDSLAKKHK